MPAESVALATTVGAWADEGGASFRVADPLYALAGIRLQTDLRLRPGSLDFGRTGDASPAEILLTKGSPYAD